jgi:Domain of unknown function (DUF4263)
VVTADAAGRYLATYVERYRREYERLIAEPPDGAGFPALVSSPYLESGDIVCFLASDGAILLDQSHEPDYDWALAGGPALMVDYPDPESRVPREVVEQLRRAGLLGKEIGIYRICFQEVPVADEIWEGCLPAPTEQTTMSVTRGPSLDVRRVELEWVELIERVTFGAYGRILDLHLPTDATANFWQPPVVRDLGFLTADRAHRRWFHYLELIRHVDEAAWDPRSAWARAKVDVRRDIAYAFAMVGRTGASVTIGAAPYEATLERFRDRLQHLEAAIRGLGSLLDEEPNADEEVFQSFLKQNPLLLDVYGEVIPQPRFVYPAGTSPLGKAYVEPDFVIRRPGDRYVLVELERPAKAAATKRGPARAELTQASFQIAEFRGYVLEHYELVKETFPGINRDPGSMVVISRSTQAAFGGRSEVRRQLQLLREQLRVEEILTYDDLLNRARAALARLSGLPFPTST